MNLKWIKLEEECYTTPNGRYVLRKERSAWAILYEDRVRLIYARTLPAAKRFAAQVEILAKDAESESRELDVEDAAVDKLLKKLQLESLQKKIEDQSEPFCEDIETLLEYLTIMIARIDATAPVDRDKGDRRRGYFENILIEVANYLECPQSGYLNKLSSVQSAFDELEMACMLESYWTARVWLQKLKRVLRDASG